MQKSRKAANELESAQSLNAIDVLDAGLHEKYVSVFNTLAGVDQLLKEVDVFLVDISIKPGLRARIRLALYEVTANIVEHSGMPASRVFEVRFTDYPNSIEFFIRSGGKKFDTGELVKQARSAPKRQPYPKRGYGLQCLAVIPNALTYRYSEGMNELVITFNKETAK